jgi:hypothetical protein
MKKHTVYHKRRPDFKGLRNNNKKINLAEYDKVAVVKAENVEDVFSLTNHVDRPWWTNKNISLIKQSRSTSVGDIVECEETFFYCDSIGWKEVKPQLKSKDKEIGD